jgi:hypothetical protein
MATNSFLKTPKALIILTGAAILLSIPMLAARGATSEKQKNAKVIDDFKDTKASPWKFITDKVMGGASTGKMAFVTHEKKSALHMTGSVSLKKKTGFIQVRRSVDAKKKYFNASNYDGLKLKVKGKNETYAVHFKTSSTVFPWQHYEATFKTNGAWQDVFIPFKDFKPISLRRAIKTSKLKTIGIVAAKKEFKADLYIQKVAFYHKADLPKESSPAP